MAYVFGSVWDRPNRNALNSLSKNVEAQGKTIQDLVAEGQLTPTQYATLIQTINGLISKGDITINDVDKNNFQLDQTYLTEELRQQMAGNTPINAVPADGSITNIKVANKAVTPGKTSFLNVGNNLINKKIIIKGKTINGSTGAVEDREGISITGFTPAPSSAVFTTNKLLRSAFYDENYDFLESRNDGTFTSPPSSKYVRFNFLNINENIVQANIGSSLLPYDEGEITFNDDYDIRISNLEPWSVGTEQIIDGAVSFEKTDFITQSSNLINPDEITIGSSVDPTTGQPQVNDGYFLSGFTKLKPNANYTGIISRVAFYDDNFNFISTRAYVTTTPVTVTTPSNTEWGRFVFQNQELGVEQLNEGNEFLEYEEFGIEIKGLKTNGAIDASDKNYYMSADNIPDYFNAPSDLGYDFTENKNQLSYQQFLSQWNTLIAENDDYFTSKVLSKDQSGTHDIVQVSAKPDRVIGSRKPLIKIIFATGMHGGEKSAIFTTYYLFKAIAERWKEDKALEYLRWNVHFEFILCASPWAFDNGVGRHNSRGVDINRNFEHGWILKDPSENDYGGTAPFSEIESRNVKKLIDDNLDAVYYGDYHNHYMQDPTWWVWMTLVTGVPGSDLMRRFSESTIRQTTLGYHKNYGLQYTNGGSGRITYHAPYAVSPSYASDKGIPASIFESLSKFDDLNDYSKSLQVGTEFVGNYFLNILKVFKDDYK